MYLCIYVSIYPSILGDCFYREFSDESICCRVQNLSLVSIVLSILLISICSFFLFSSLDYNMIFFNMSIKTTLTVMLQSIQFFHNYHKSVNLDTVKWVTNLKSVSTWEVLHFWSIYIFFTTCNWYSTFKKLLNNEKFLFFKYFQEKLGNRSQNLLLYNCS